MDTRDVRKMLQAIASTAQEAADEAKERMYSAGQSLSDKYDAAKLNLALSRTKGEQERIFTDMGRIQFLMAHSLYRVFDDDFEEIADLEMFLDEIPDYLALNITTEYQRLKAEFEKREDLK